jgi:L-lysine exporter family protein LysE/ArgO
MLSLMPSLRYSVSGSPVALTIGKTARESTDLGSREVESKPEALATNRADLVSGLFHGHSVLDRYQFESRNVVLVSYIHVLSAAFLMGLAAAAPMGPVNMLAIRRGVIGGWQHTLACGIGSITGDLILFSLILLGGDYLFPDLANPTLQTVLAAIGAIVLLPLGIYFLVRTVKEPLRAYASARQHWDEGTVPRHVVAEIGNAAALTIFNPLTMTYWVGVTSNWLPIAHSVLGYSAPGLGILMATSGLMTWFTALTVFVRFIPNRIGPNFFRLVNAFFGLILLGFATFCAIVLSRHLLH